MPPSTPTLFVVSPDVTQHKWLGALLPSPATLGKVSYVRSLGAVEELLRQDPGRVNSDAVIWVGGALEVGNMEVLGDFLERYTALPLVVIAEHYSQATMAWLFRKGVWELAQRHQVDREWAVDMAREILDLAGATTQDAEPQPARGLATPKMIPAPGRTPDMVGRVLDGRWLLHTLMDEGGMGLVFQATDQDMGRECAVKVVHPKLVSDGRIRDRFMREVLILHAVEHSHIPAMYGSGLDHVTQSPYVVMELLQGRNLRSTLMKFKRLPLGDCLWIAEGALRALGALHKARILHRDVKPENIFLHSSSPESYKAYLLDFGVSRVTDMQMRYQTEPGIVCGTPQYMAPEQQRDQPIDHRVDYYSLGLVLFEMFTGMRCGDGFDPKPLAEDEERLARWREALEGHPSEVAQAATRWLRWLTQRDPAQRPQTSTAALQSLRRLRRLLVKEPADTLSVPDMLKRQD